MASSPENGPTKNETTNPVEKENPFIKFRRYADAHVSAFLQGIIGLPSTFSSRRNPHWADFKEDPRVDSSVKSHEDTASNAPLDPDYKYHNELAMFRPQGTTVDEIPKTKQWRSMYFPSHEVSSRDIPLYSVVTKDLFAHLGGPSSRQWGSGNVTHPLDSLQSKHLPFEIFQGQRTSDVLQQVQFMALNELDKRPSLRSEYSLLPYLLFSPYSPIQLEETAKAASFNGNDGEIKGDTFPYSIAFEDLIYTTHGGRYQSPYKHFHPFERFHLGYRHKLDPSVNWMGWIHNLYGTNLLQQREVKVATFTAPNIKDYRLSPFALMHQAVLDEGQPLKSIVAPITSTEPETEQEMYDELASWISSPTAILGSFATMMQDPERWIEDKIKTLESEQGQKVAKKVMDENLPKEFRDMIAQLNDSRLHGPDAEELQKVFEYINGEEFSRHSEEKSKQLEQLKSILRFLIGPEEEKKTPPYVPEQSLWVPDLTTQSETSVKTQNASDKSEDSEARVVATSTTTEQTTHEDGSTETFVTVWKRFSDGRESTTTTNHNTNPACDENGNPVEQRASNAEAAKERRVQERKGWFWN